MATDRKTLKEQYAARTQVGGVYAIRCTKSDAKIIGKTLDLQGSKNRFSFAQMTNACFDLELKADWAEYGPQSFEFVVIEQIEKKDTQTEQEFADDITALLELVKGK